MRMPQQPVTKQARSQLPVSYDAYLGEGVGLLKAKNGKELDLTHYRQQWYVAQPPTRKEEMQAV